MPNRSTSFPRIAAVCTTVVLSFSAVLLASCKGDDGPVGPAGTANVTYSQWQSLTSIVDTTIDNSAMKVGHLAAPGLTDSVLQTGAVLVYMKFGSLITPLPYTSNAGLKPSTVSFIVQTNQLLITRFSLDNSAPAGFGGQFRYVLVPGGTVSANYAADTHQGVRAVLQDGDLGPDYSAMSYEQVRAALNIPE